MKNVTQGSFYIHETPSSISIKTDGVQHKIAPYTGDDATIATMATSKVIDRGQARANARLFISANIMFETMTALVCLLEQSEGTTKGGIVAAARELIEELKK